MTVAILGGGLSALTAEFCLRDKKNINKIIIIEKERELGGLCRSFKNKFGTVFDIGPHILFSKNEKILSLLISIVSTQKIRRSNRVIHDKKYFQYPFENDLGKLNDDEKKYVERTFIHNDYKNYNPTNMQQFFLNRFGEGISNLYLLPYNKKIWKWDPSYLDLQMVERIPAPTEDDIKLSLNGKTIDGYIHQLYFHYPIIGGMGNLIRSFEQALSHKTKVYLNNKVTGIKNNNGKYIIKTLEENLEADYIISTIPLLEFTNIFPKKDLENKKLYHNDIYEVAVTCSNWIGGDNFAFMTANPNIIFHRISKVDYLGNSYHQEGTTSFLVEVTVKQDQILESSYLYKEIKKGLIECFPNDRIEILDFEIRRFNNAYVIYDLNHRQNVDFILNKYKDEKISFIGRQGTHEYKNMDAVFEDSIKLGENWNE